MSFRFDSTRTPDIVVIGAGLIGMAIALELHDRGANVTVVDRRESLGGASTAAAGMLAADDPGNPPELRELSRLSAERYSAFLGRLEALSGIAVPFQTNTTLQYLEDGSTLRLAEHSLDPRQLAAAVRAAVNATSIRLLEHTQIVAVHQDPGGASIELIGGQVIDAQAVVYAAGAWTSEVMAALDSDHLSITPCKGQMLRVRLPFPLDEVHRCERIYICPRTHGPQAGTALIGATVEDAGFDTSVHADDLDALRALAAKLIPEFVSEAEAPMVESWAGLRPATPDRLPILGACSRPGQFIATGHYRNGILQAPGTALVMADLIEGKAPAIDLSALSPLRFACSVTT
ncbi:MAG: FAD-dependent oxidoreductase [Acidobacteriaceae bacterium]|jgi:glycine oxidase